MKLALAALCAVAACSRSTAPGEPPSPTPSAAPSPTPSAPSAPPQDATLHEPPAPTASVIPAATTQLITAIVPAWSSTTAELRLWTREGDGWRPAGPAWPGVIGKTGAAWGAGLHGVGAPAGHDGPRKHEGDGRSPAGVFALRGAYGSAPAAPAGTSRPYTQVDASWKCVDDPSSSHYNQILDQRTATIDWRSAEAMQRTDALYTWVVEVAHNPARVRGDGSCIFLHVWRGPRSVTVGCTAMNADKLAALIAALDPAQAPVFVLLPRAAYEALAIDWALPRG